MRTTPLLNLASALPLLLATIHAADIRSVGGVLVNVDPVHQWMSNPRGERPMRHWRDFTPIKYLGVINGAHAFRVVVALDGNPAPRLVVGIDGNLPGSTSRGVIEVKNGQGSHLAHSETKEILLKNPPLSMLRLGQEVRALEVGLGQAEAGELTAKRGVVVASAHERMTPRPGFAGHAFGSRSDVYSQEARAQAARNLRAKAEAARRLTELERESLERQLRRCLPRFRETHELAMFTGQTIAGREVWDCGAGTR